MAMLPIALGIGRLPPDNPYVGTLHHGAARQAPASNAAESRVLVKERNNPHAPYMRHAPVAPARKESSSSITEWELVEDDASAYVHVEQ